MKKDLIYRERYLDTVRPFIGKQLIKVFTGQRRVGKSYLLFQIMQEIRSADEHAPIIYINKEDLAFSHLKTAQALADFVLSEKKHGQKNYVFIDEIQEIANFESALRSLLLDDELDLYCTGSNAHLLSRDIAGALSERAVEIHVHSLSYPEFLQFMRLEDSDKAMAQFLKYGGLPYLKDLPLQDNIIFEYLRNIYSTIAIRDIVNRYSLRNPQFLEQLTFLIHKVPRYDIAGKRIFEIGEKYYFEDLGLRNALIGYRVQDRGKLLENTIFNHLQIAGFDVKIGGLNNQEIDFVAEKNGERIYVQATLTINEEKTLEREFGNLLKIGDNYPKYVVTLDEFDGNTFEGVRCLSLRGFIGEILETPLSHL